MYAQVVLCIVQHSLAACGAELFTVRIWLVALCTDAHLRVGINALVIKEMFQVLSQEIHLGLHAATEHACHYAASQWL